LVIALDGKWGTGKSVFLHQLKGLLSHKEFPVIYFDAFENDYVEDAFSALARELVEFLDENRSAGSSIGKEVTKQAKKVGKLLLRGGLSLGARLAVRVVTAGTSGLGEVEAAARDAQGAVGDAAAQYIDDLLTEPQLQKTAIEEFKVNLSALPLKIAEYKERKTAQPLIFIIDELDRCKPTFALSIVERIKHFMSVPNVHFVLGVNLDQLRNSVRAAYGSKVDAQTYLQKFIGLTVMFNEEGADAGTTKVRRYVEYLLKAMEFRPEDTKIVAEVGRILVEYAERSPLSLRQIDRIYTQLAACLTFAGSKGLRPAGIIAGLCMLKILDPPLFSAAKRGQLTYENILNPLALEPRPEGSEEIYRYFRDEWRYCLGLDPEVVRKEELDAEFLGRYGMRKRELVISFVANQVVDRLVFG
jgi:hypothetical protein